MLEQAYRAQCNAMTLRGTAREQGNCNFTLFALALGSFCIGTSEFASMGVIQLFAADLHATIPDATQAIAGYALGVIVGAPLITLAAARLNRRGLLLLLMLLFMVGNVLSAASTSLGWLAVARFVSGLPQGAYFGAGAVVATYVYGPGQSGKAFATVMSGLTVATIFGSPLATVVGQALGWRNTYLAVAALSVCGLLALWRWVPRTEALRGRSIVEDLPALRKPRVWGVMAVAAIGVGSIFAVYTFIGPYVTDAARLSPAFIPLALGAFGVGMTVGNAIGGRLADVDAVRGVLIGFGAALVVLAALALNVSDAWVLLPSMLGVGTAMMVAIPTLQVRLTRFAPEAPTLMGAMNLAALNLSNAIGTWAGGAAVRVGGHLSYSVWAGFSLTLAGLLLFLLTRRMDDRPDDAPATGHLPSPGTT